MSQDTIPHSWANFKGKKLSKFDISYNLQQIWDSMQMFPVKRRDSEQIAGYYQQDKLLCPHIFVWDKIELLGKFFSSDSQTLPALWPRIVLLFVWSLAWLKFNQEQRPGNSKYGIMLAPGQGYL